MAAPPLQSVEDAQNLARLIQAGKITGPARDNAMQALRDFHDTQQYAAGPAVGPTGMTDEQYEKSLQDWKQQQVNNMSTGERFWLGMGKGVNDLGQGISQWWGGTSRPEVALERQEDAPLMNTSSGRWGVTAGKAMAAAPTALIPGAGTLGGAALIGAGLGAAEPSTSTRETATNIGLGGVAGPLGLLVGRGAGVLWQGGKALVEPFLKGGSDRIAARVLQSFTGNPSSTQKLVTALQNPPAVLPGVQPTTAELAGSPGLNGLERTMNNKPEFNQDLTTRLQSNNAATAHAVQGIAGTPADLEAAQAARAAASNPLYKAAGDVRATSDAALDTLMKRPSMQKAMARAQELAAERGEQLAQGRDVIPAARPAILSRADEAAENQLVTVDPGKLDAGWQARGMRVGPNGEGGIVEDNGLSRYDRAKALYQSGHTMEAPSVDVDSQGGVTFIDGRHRAAAMRDLGDSAITVAMDPQSLANAQAQGMVLQPQRFTDYSGRALQYLKLALQDAVNQGEQRGMGAHELAATKGTLNALQQWITKNVPELRAADEAFAQGSVPVNQMQIGQKLSDTLRPALSDFSTAPNRLNANAFAQSVRNGDRLARQVTGDETATLAGTLSPDQQSTLRLVGEQLARRSAVNDVGRAVGSNTAQNLIGENFANQALGPLGLPQNAVGRLTRAVLGAALAKPYQLAAGAAEPDVQRALTDALLNPSSAARLLSQPVSPRYAQAAWRNQRFLTPAAAQAALATQGVQ